MHVLTGMKQKDWCNQGHMCTMKRGGARIGWEKSIIYNNREKGSDREKSDVIIIIIFYHNLHLQTAIAAVSALLGHFSAVQ